MKFRIRKFLTMSMLFSMFGGFISGMEDGKREGWNLIFGSELPSNQTYAIIVDKKNCEYFELWNLFGYQKPNLDKKLNLSSSFKLSVPCEAYQGGGSCVRCNAKITNSQENNAKKDESYKFEKCTCRLCFGCGVSMDNFGDYKCNHGHTLEDSEKKCISMIKAKYNDAKLNKRSFYEGVSEQDLEKARKNFIDALFEFSKSKGKIIGKKEIGKSLSKMILDDYCQSIKLVFDSSMIDIINSAISYVIKEKLDAECPICNESTHAVCIPQCGHPICLDCLKGVVDRNNQCPVCRSRFYRIIILREKMDSNNLENFLTSNKSWILQAVNG